MFCKLIAKYGLSLHLALLAALPVALAPFLPADSLSTVLFWLGGWGALWIFAEPSSRRGEYRHEARKRVVSGIVRDPLFYCLLAVTVYAGLRMLNGGVALKYDVEAAVWKVCEPSLSAFPASATGAGTLPFAVALAVLVVVTGIRQALGLSARISFAILTSCFTGAGALFMVYQLCQGNAAYVRAATLPLADGPFFGTFFGAFLPFGIHAAVAAEGKKWPWARLAAVVAIGGNASGAVFFLPPALAAGYLAFAAVFAIFNLSWSARGASFGAAARAVFFIVVGLGMPVLFFAFVPPELKSAKLAALDPQAVFPAAYQDARAALSRIAGQVWMQHPWCGTGEGVFRLQVPFFAEKADWLVLPHRPVFANNGWWMMLAERGIIGTVACLAVLVFLLANWCVRLAGAFARLRGDDESDVFLFACSPLVWSGPVTMALMAAENFLSPAFAMAPAAMAVTVPLAFAVSSFPKKKNRDN